MTNSTILQVLKSDSVQDHLSIEPVQELLFDGCLVYDSILKMDFDFDESREFNDDIRSASEIQG
ncbi:MAG: hypothetical protein ACFFEU_00510 [Candidatus Thorarchaeota archaeon]